LSPSSSVEFLEFAREHFSHVLDEVEENVLPTVRHDDVLVELAQQRCDIAFPFPHLPLGDSHAPCVGQALHDHVFGVQGSMDGLSHVRATRASRHRLQLRHALPRDVDALAPSRVDLVDEDYVEFFHVLAKQSNQLVVVDGVVASHAPGGNKATHAVKYGTLGLENRIVSLPAGEEVLFREDFIPLVSRLEEYLVDVGLGREWKSEP
jgi:hypothetical protein